MSSPFPMCCAVSRRARSPNRPRQKLSREFRRQCRRASASADAAVARNLKARSGVCIMLLSWSIMSRCSQLSAFAPAFQSLHHFHFLSFPRFPSSPPSTHPWQWRSWSSEPHRCVAAALRSDFAQSHSGIAVAVFIRCATPWFSLCITAGVASAPPSATIWSGLA